MAYILVSTFFAAIGMKCGLAISADAKRRLRLLYLGTRLAMTPALVITLIELLRGHAAHKIFPDWLGVVVLAMLALFPLTPAYVIVVQRAMDVRIAHRQGFQHA